MRRPETNNKQKWIVESRLNYMALTLLSYKIAQRTNKCPIEVTFCFKSCSTNCCILYFSLQGVKAPLGIEFQSLNTWFRKKDNSIAWIPHDLLPHFQKRIFKKSGVFCWFLSTASTGSTNCLYKELLHIPTLRNYPHVAKRIEWKHVCMLSTFIALSPRNTGLEQASWIIKSSPLLMHSCK